MRPSAKLCQRRLLRDEMGMLRNNPFTVGVIQRSSEHGRKYIRTPAASQHVQQLLIAARKIVGSRNKKIAEQIGSEKFLPRAPAGPAYTTIMRIGGEEPAMQKRLGAE